MSNLIAGASWRTRRVPKAHIWFLLPLLSVTGLGGCSAPRSDLGPAEWREVGCFSKSAPSLSGVINSQAQLQQFWSEYCQEQPAQAPTLDFKKSSVMYYYIGERNWYIQIERIEPGPPAKVELTLYDTTDCPTYDVHSPGFLIEVAIQTLEPQFESVERDGCA